MDEETLARIAEAEEDAPDADGPSGGGSASEPQAASRRVAPSTATALRTRRR